MPTLFAIGGGEIADRETEGIDRAVLDATGVALENDAAIEVRDGEWRVHTNSPNAFAFHLRARGDERSVEPLAADGRYRSLDELR